ncbi:MAG: PPOX class F420-dependent oxidoreductase [Deltaproteobacteria bacterium]|nr:PPOX class F420-dependent oxidoreductase [Deltaproteobacteria bacterium]MBI3387595.1 PPOX class F420-dependent oxidoreductase [Deltaproteobacteria bacterium]
MAKTIPAAFLDLTKKKALAHLATVMPDGSPQVSPVWFDYDGRHIRVNSARDRVKDRNMERDRRVALSVVDPDNAYRCVMIRGKVVDITETGADAHIDALAKTYLDMDAYPFRRPGEHRVIYVIEPTQVSVMP